MPSRTYPYPCGQCGARETVQTADRLCGTCIRRRTAARSRLTRRYACVDCGAPNTARHARTRCPACSAVHDVRVRAQRRDHDQALARARAAAMQARRAREARAAARQARRATWADTDPDVQRYRATKAAHAAWRARREVPA